MNFGMNKRAAFGNFNQLTCQQANINLIRDFPRDKTTKKCFENKIGHWTQRQNAKYYSFLKKFHEKFSQKQARRQYKVFKALAQFVKSRNSNQCRSHHHKMRKNYNNIEQILVFLAQKHPNIEKKSQKYLEKLQNLQQEIFSQANKEKYQSFNYNCNNQKNQSPRNHLNAQIFKSLDLTKANNIFLMKTADEYECQQKLQKNLNEKVNNYQNYQLNCFPSAQILFKNYQNQYNNLTYYPVNFNYNIDPAQGISRTNYHHQLTPYQIKLKQCHECFQRWYLKVDSLIKRQNLEQGLIFRMKQNQKPTTLTH